MRLELAGEPCATSEVMERKIAERSERILFSPAGARELRAEFVRLSHSAVLARLSLRREEGDVATRELRAPTCEEAVDALALVAAMTLDPSLALGESSGTLGEAQPAQPAQPAEKPRPPLVAPRTNAVAEVNTPARTLSNSEPSGTRFSVGASFAATWGPAPYVLPGAAVYFGVAWPTATALSPSLRVSLSRVWRGGFGTEYGSAAFALTGAALELCPVALGGQVLELRPCGMFNVGLLSAEGSRTEAARTERRPWAMLGASAIVEAQVVENVAVSGAAALGRTLVRDRFEFSPAVFHRVPALAFYAGLGAGVRFP